MCGRYVIYDQLTKGSVSLLGHKITANFNIAPTTYAPIIRPNSKTKEQELIMARWGLLPRWAKDLKIPPFFNARADNLEGNKVFRPSISQRCLVPMSGFYEWSEHDKQPYFIHLEPKQLFYTAGLWNRWQSKEGEIIDSFSVITTKPNSVLDDIHHRMPVILNQNTIKSWLYDTYDQAKSLFQPFKGGMAKYPVNPKAVNNARNNRLHNIEAL